jgi:phage gpG-like protein
MVNIGYSFTPTIAMSAKAFNTLDIDIRSFREPLKRSIQRVVAPSIQKNFIAGGRPTGWTPLSDATLIVKARDPKTRFPVSDPLLRSGLLYKTMGQFNIWTVTQTQAAILSLPDKIWYGGIHQAGYGSSSAVSAGATSAEGFKTMMDQVLSGGLRAYIPARPFAMVQTEDLDAIQTEFEIWLNERIVARLGLLCLDLIPIAPKSSRTTSTRSFSSLPT